MKTIKEVAQEYANRTDKENSEFVMEDFQAGVEFAQRWIPIEEELPPVSDKDILIKGVDHDGNEGIVDIGYMHAPGESHINIISLSSEISTVTHWRLIDLK